MPKAKDFPACAEAECAACEQGYCTVLIDNDFGTRKCPFFKTREQAAKDKAYREKRLADIGIRKKEADLC